ncbi:GNAT family N-acetyltransferase [Pedobacter panaciterrae]|uniref:GNAT family N-acetyltransferase n=1 Tax=Pedobacter panaciterrae TaxID=363849 RepID=A0ABU8NL83_9SPHI
MKITYRKLESSDIKQLLALVGVYERVFEMQNFEMPSVAYLQTLLENQQIVFFSALDDYENVVGGMTAYMMPSIYYAAPEVYIYDLAVEVAWQRKGVGRRLIEELKSFCKGHGCKFVFVQADLADQHAIDFYRSTGGIQEDVVHFDYQL